MDFAGHHQPQDSLVPCNWSTPLLYIPTCSLAFKFAPLIKQKRNQISPEKSDLPRITRAANDGAGIYTQMHAHIFLLVSLDCVLFLNPQGPV